MVVIWLPLVVCIIGLIVYMVSANGKAQTLARDAFWTGLLVTLLMLAGHGVAIR